MSIISGEEWQLLSFFEVEPELREANELWCYNDALYKVQQGDIELSVAIAPAYRDVRIVLKHCDVRIYELNAMAIRDIRYRKDDATETLEIDLGICQGISLRIKPQIELLQAFEESA
jgi:hypothetical protein